MKNFEQLTVSDYLSIVRRRILYLIVPTVVISVGVLLYVQTMPSIYRSETNIQVFGRVVPEDYIPSLDRQTNNDIMSFVESQLQSRTFLERVVRELKLAGPEAANIDGAIGGVRANEEFTQLGANQFKIAYKSTDPNMAQAVAARLAAMVIELNGSFRKEKAQDADQFLDEEQQKAAEDLGRVEARLARFQNQKFSGYSQGPISLESLRILQSDLKEQDKLLQSLGDTRRQLEQRLEEQRQLRVLASTPRTGVSQATQSVPTGSSEAASLEDALAKKKKEYAAALRKYTEAFPGVAQLANEVRELEESLKHARSASNAAPSTNLSTSSVVNKSPTSGADSSIDFDLLLAEIQLQIEQTDKQIARAEKAKNDLQTQIAAYQQQLNPSTAVAQEIARLTQDFQTAQQRYNFLTNKKLNSALAVRVDASDGNDVFRVIDPAYLPRYPIAPNRPLYNLVGLIAGILFGFGMVFGREFLDTTIHDKEEAAELGVAILASIPEVKPEVNDQSGAKIRNKVHLNLVPSVQNLHEEAAPQFRIESVDSKVRSVVLGPLSVAGEQLRLLRFELSRQQKCKALKTILIASAIPGEGKTYVACCIASILAQEPGKRVLLIDADLRGARLGVTLGIGSDCRGLSELLRDAVQLNESLVTCPELNLSFLPAGGAVDRPAEQLSSHNFERHLRLMAPVFDWIIIDSAPMLALADSNIIANHCDASLLVVRAGRTSKSLVKQAIQRIGRDHLCGIVMNCLTPVESKYSYRYYYRQFDDSRTVQK
jgi:tyrosine-protein kinase Etk/Wzc